VDHKIYVSIVDNNNVKEIQAGQILTYRIPSEYLNHYKGAIYIIKENSEYVEEITFNNRIIQGTLECVNFNPLLVILRLYYILSVIDSNLILNIEYKKELLKYQIERMANRKCYSFSRNLDCEYNYLECILPFIKYDY
jgi:hypothetical protein